MADQTDPTTRRHSHAAPSSLEITLCRYDSSGRIEKQVRDIRATEFLAISHVWNDADWRTIESSAGEEVLVSSEKARFLLNQLPSIVGTEWFWMDILCVQQRDADARVAVTQHIPWIFRFAKRTIAIRDSNGFQSCCVEAVGRVRDFFGKSRFARSKEDDESHIDFSDEPDGRAQLGQHIYDCHRDDTSFQEGMLTRLWPLQEIMLSNSIQFVRCAPDPDAPRSIPAPSNTLVKGIALGSRLIQSLSSLAILWSTFANGHDADDNTWHRIGFLKNDFVSAYLSLTTVTRHTTPILAAHVPKARDVLMHISSTRQTSKPRDFILAIMPQYSFYTVPANARKLPFADLFLDCAHQLRSIDCDLAPLIGDFEHLLDGRPGPIMRSIPAPTCLGDLAKLFNGPILRTPEGSTVELIPIQAVPISTVMASAPSSMGLDCSEFDSVMLGVVYAGLAIHIVVRSIFNSTLLWLSAHHEIAHELSLLPQTPEYKFRRRALKALALIRDAVMADGFEHDSYQTACDVTQRGDIMELLRPVPWEVTMWYASMISCCLGISSFEWAREQLVPVRVEVNQVSLLAMGERDMVRDDTMFFLTQAGDFKVGRDGPMGRVALLTGNTDVEGYFSLALFPPDTKLKGSRMY